MHPKSRLHMQKRYDGATTSKRVIQWQQRVNAIFEREIMRPNFTPIEWNRKVDTVFNSGKVRIAG